MYIFLGGGDYSWFNIIFSSNQKRKKKHSIPLAPLVNMPSHFSVSQQWSYQQMGQGQDSKCKFRSHIGLVLAFWNKIACPTYNLQMDAVNKQK